MRFLHLSPAKPAQPFTVGGCVQSMQNGTTAQHVCETNTATNKRVRYVRMLNNGARTRALLAVQTKTLVQARRGACVKCVRRAKLFAQSAHVNATTIPVWGACKGAKEITVTLLSACVPPTRLRRSCYPTSVYDNKRHLQLAKLAHATDNCFR